jgi:hypothetical protein
MRTGDMTPTRRVTRYELRATERLKGWRCKMGNRRLSRPVDKSGRASNAFVRMLITG